MSKKIIIIILISNFIAIGVGVYGGMKYTENAGQNPPEADLSGQNRGNNISDASGDHAGDFRERSDSRQNGSRPLFGEIISQDENGVTIKLRDGSTKIIFIDNNVQITKSIEGVLGDLKESAQISVSGEQNPDGSYTAETIQIRPQLDHAQE